ncbi:PAS domain-containing protein [Puteibacter caeruleilacunae]|nr:PAS domain-containing protein [Puteibacter caeruleilacunae]
MRYKTKLLIYLITLNVLLIGISTLFYSTNKSLFMIFEGIFVLSIIVGYILYNQFSKTMGLINSGIESLKDHDFSMKLRPGNNKEFNAFIGVYNKMIDQLRKERISLSEKSFLITKLMEASPSGIMIFDFDDQLTSMNPAAEKFLGKSFEQVKLLKLAKLSQQAGGMLDKSPESANYIFRKNGHEAYRIQTGFFVDRGFDTRFILIEELTEEIRNTEKQAYEKVIRMMSHEINNSVAAVNSVLNTIRPKLESFEGYEQTIDACISRNENLNNFTRNLADVVRIPAPQLRSTDLNHLVEKIYTIVQSQNDKVKFVLNQCDETPDILADESQLEQVLINILKNSVEAVNGAGEITITTTCAPVQIIVTDNGCGFAEQDRDKMFTPFYTSKPNGQGIGLTVTREILTNHNCSFSLERKDDMTYFSITFPK